MSSINETIKWLEDTDEEWSLFLDTEGATELVKKSIEELIEKEMLYVARVDAH